MATIHDARNKGAGRKRGANAPPGGAEFYPMKSGSPHIRYLPPTIRRRFRRFLQLEGVTQSQWLLSLVRRSIAEKEAQLGSDIFDVLTPDERHIMDVIRDGAAELAQIVAETQLTTTEVEATLEELARRKRIERRKRGGKTDGARGAATTLYFLVE